MKSKARRRLERMRRSPANCKRRDIERLLADAGFTVRYGGDHDVYTHLEFKRLRFTLPRHDKLKLNYYRDTVKLVDKVLELRNTTVSSQD